MKRTTASARPRAPVKVNLAFVEKLRKDFLTLLKNLPNVKDYETAQELREAFNVYRDRFDDLFFKRFLDQTLKYELGLSADNIEYVDGKIRKSGWQFTIELRLPIESSDEYCTESRAFARFKQEFPKWKTRVQTKGQAFWKDMKEVLDFLKGEFSVDVPTKQNIEIEGFKVRLDGYEPDRLDYRGNLHYEAEGASKLLEKIRRGLKIYRANALKTMPWLIKNQLPIVLKFETTLDQAGQYKYVAERCIELFASSFKSETPERVAHVAAHEMGHHLYKHLDKAADEFWYATIRGDYKELDIKYLLSKWPEGKNIWITDIEKHLADEDPVLGLQISTTLYSQFYRNETLEQRSDFEKLLERGVKTIRVPATPITDYAGKNAEEAFCEAIGMLVAYGPRAIDERVRYWLRTALPGMVKGV